MNAPLTGTASRAAAPLHASTVPALSIVIPVYNEEDGLQALFDRLYPALDAMALAYEIVFVNDGSRDRSAALLAAQFRLRPDVTRVVLFNGNFGQHMAIMAGFAHTRGDIVVTLDADLQNPPEEIPRLVEAVQAGHDYVGTVRRDRSDTAFRRVASRAMNALRERITRIRMTDQGCMLRAYDRPLVDTLNACHESNTFIPALAYTFAANPVEIEVAHEERFAGESKYSLYQLIRLNFDLITGFSIVPLQWLSVVGMGLSLLSGALFVLLLVRRFVWGAEVEGVFTLFALQFFLTGILLFGIGLMGEYIGRIHQEVRQRPRYRVQAVLQAPNEGRVMRDARPVYAVLCVVGAVLPLSQVAPWLVDHGLSLPLLVRQAFAEPVSAFAWADVVVSALVLVVFIVVERQRRRIGGWWWAVVALCLVGVSLALPLFLFLRERAVASHPFETVA